MSRLSMPQRLLPFLVLGTVAVRLIIDTDMSTDCDDVAAVCIANALHNRGEVCRIAVTMLAFPNQ